MSGGRKMKVNAPLTVNLQNETVVSGNMADLFALEPFPEVEAGINYLYLYLNFYMDLYLHLLLFPNFCYYFFLFAT